MENNVVIIGGGAAGMMAAITAARSGHKVHVLEKNEKLGKKLFITGKGRCNVTNDCDVETLLKNVVTNSKFLYSAFYSFNSQDMMAFLQELGLPLKTERGNRVFPASDKSSDVIRVLERQMKQLGVCIHLKSTAKRIVIRDGHVAAVEYDHENQKELLPASRVIVATGGLSYKSTGSDGDGYAFAKDAGHTVTKLMPSLVPLNIREDWCKSLQGLSLKNVRAEFYQGKKKLYEDFGEMLFTHYGVSGPLILSGSAYILKALEKSEPIRLCIDLKPALSFEQLDARILRDFGENINRQFGNSLSALLPSKLIPVVVELSGIDGRKTVNAISREERHQLVRLLKNLTMTVEGTRDYNEAIITRGGVSVKEINPSTMESRKVSGLYFAGEVLDLDALTGGFNLQIAWSSAWLAGNNL
ncbi:MAG TPA: NAD(P)/FAD-dependent oxidoreductase [Candidatus Scybalocola faecigallinarum]|uniref:NAD(P)/FAD-dependent oxidoreductase n=1 Tax=Candidatus Scybalocola faecigallinarum TaxID=2840941 RepID=A0A9D1F7C4_9FIRM|nr:NAD(P)/FAD-dependent oxidoreductase [Candidatus Scybalocola faecigallinarum]